MKDLLILGTGVHALEMAEIVERVNRAEPTWNLVGYITNDEKQVGQTLNSVPVVGTPADLSKYPGASLVPAFSEWKKMGNLPVKQMTSLIDPAAFVSRTAVIGRGCVLYPGCFVGLNAKIGDFVFCLSGAVINHDDIVERGVTLASAATLAGHVHVEPDCYLGQACSVRQHLTIGHGSLIGMGAVVIKNVEPDSVMAGNPANKINDKAVFVESGTEHHAPVDMRSGLECRAFSDRTPADVMSVINAYTAAWPYTRPVDEHLVEHWKTLSRFQPEHIRIAYRDGIPRAFLHGERDGEAMYIHLLAVVPGGVEEGVWLSREFETEARRHGVTRLVGPHYRSNAFYGAYVLGCEPCHPHWAIEGTEVWVRAGFRIGHPGVLMVCDLSVPIEPAGAPPAGYTIVASPDRTEFDAEPFGFHAILDGRKVAHCYARLYPDMTCPGGAPVGQIGNVTTEEAHRGKGLAGIMGRMCLEIMCDRGAGECLVATGLDNMPALRAYEKIGFERRFNINRWTKDLT